MRLKFVICLLYFAYETVSAETALNFETLRDVNSTLCSSRYIGNKETYNCSIQEHVCSCIADTAKVNLRTFKNKPKLICRTHNLLKIQWPLAPSFEYVLQWKQKNSTWTLLEVDQSGIVVIDHLQPKTSYEIRLIGAMPSCEVHGLTTTLETLSSRPHALRPSDVTIHKLQFNGERYDALVNITPTDSSCNLHIAALPDSGYLFPIESNITEPDLNKPPPFQIPIPNLEVENTYTLSIKSKIGENESEALYLPLTTPSCMESYHSLYNCPPEVPLGLNYSTQNCNHSIDQEEYFCDINLTWTLPELIPDYYTVRIFSGFPIPKHSDPLAFNVSGDATSYIIRNISVETGYKGSVRAYSIGGESGPAYFGLQKTNQMQKEEVWLNHKLIIALVSLLLVTFFCVILAIIRKKQTIKHFGMQINNLYLEVFKKGQFSDDEVIGRLSSDVDEWELDSKELKFDKILGEGAFGVVRKGVLTKDGQSVHVAIKMLKDVPTIEEIRQFQQEIQIMKSVGSHTHLVSMIGCVTYSSKTTPLLVVEYCSKGDLQSYLRNEFEKLVCHMKRCQNRNILQDTTVFNKMYEMDMGRSPELINSQDLLSFARQIALGMEYLSNMRVIHRDLAARNVLVCDGKIVKVSDFGLSRDVYQDNVYRKTGGGKLPMKWMAIESLTHQLYTTQSDVWAYGILLWEIVTLGEHPYPGICTSDLLKLLKAGYRMECPKNCGSAIYDLMLSCWKEHPKDRPTFTDIRLTLELFLESVSKYIDIKK